MKRKMMEKEVYEEKDSEDWCFVCKDGGELMLCDYKDCLKVYHPSCVGKKKSFSGTGKRWTCRRHSCSLCFASAKFFCFCCPNSVCRHCISGSEFTLVRGKKGFCKYCLQLIVLAEENSEYGIDGIFSHRRCLGSRTVRGWYWIACKPYSSDLLQTKEKIDFTDRDTFECLFKEYWEIIKEKEGLTSDDVYSAHLQLKKGENQKCRFDSVNISESEEDNALTISDSETEDTEVHKSMGKKKALKAQEYAGWGSKPLIEFLASIGKDTSQQLSQYDVDSIIHDYIRERNLFDPKKKRKVLCDDKLYSIFRRKSLDRIRIYGLLGTHITENLVDLVSSDESRSGDEDESKLEDKKKDTMITSKKRKVSSDIKSLGAEVRRSARQSGFASIVADNIKLVYLRRSLIEELMKQPENSENKVLGSFVRVKNDPTDYLQRNSHQLLQVKGIRKISTVNGINSEILVQVSNMTRDIPIFMLSDSDFTEEECEDLRRNVRNGLLKKPTFVELEQKARDLHEDITKHWIERELVRLQNCIDRANERGWRRELCAYMDQRELLKKPSEQERLLKQVPRVIAEVLEDESGSVHSE